MRVYFGLKPKLDRLKFAGIHIELRLMIIGDNLPEKATKTNKSRTFICNTDLRQNLII